MRAPFVQGVLLLLLIASIASWAIIIDKRRLLKQAIKLPRRVRDELLVGRGFQHTVSRHRAGGSHAAGHGRNFRVRVSRVRQAKADRAWAPEQLIEGSRRAMRVSQLREMDRLEHNLAFLATVSNTSPYIGLFGTVWGIMSSFHALGSMQSATIAMVAPGISEALIATAMGLFAAIPAGIFFNRYADQVTRLEVRYDTFMEELSAIFQRNAARRDPARRAAPVRSAGDLAEAEP